MKVLPVWRYILATQLEPTHAREVFPCFDEPEMKAVFNVTIIHRRGTVALGNADKSGKEKKDRKKTEATEWQMFSLICIACVLFSLS